MIKDSSLCLYRIGRVELGGLLKLSLVVHQPDQKQGGG